MKKHTLLIIASTLILSALLFALSVYMSRDLELKSIEKLDVLYLTENLPEANDEELTVLATSQDGAKLMPYAKEVYADLATRGSFMVDNYFLTRDDYREQLDFTPYASEKTVISLCKDEYFYTSELATPFIIKNRGRDHRQLLNRKLSDIAKCNVSVLTFGIDDKFAAPQKLDSPTVYEEHRLAFPGEYQYTVDETAQTGVQLTVVDRPIYYAQRYEVDIEPFDRYLLQFGYQAHNTKNLRFAVRFYTQDYLDRMASDDPNDYDPTDWSQVDHEEFHYYYDVADNGEHLLQQVVSTKLDDVIGVDIIYFADSWTKAVYSFQTPQLYALKETQRIQDYRDRYNSLPELVPVNITDVQTIPVSYLVGENVENGSGYEREIFIERTDYSTLLLQLDGVEYTVRGEYSEYTVEDVDSEVIVIDQYETGPVSSVLIKNGEELGNIHIEALPFSADVLHKVLPTNDKRDYTLYLLEKPYSGNYYFDVPYMQYETNHGWNLYLVSDLHSLTHARNRNAEGVRLMAILLIPFGLLLSIIYSQKELFSKFYRKVAGYYLRVNKQFSDKLLLPLLGFIFESKDISYKGIFDKKSGFLREVDDIIGKIVTDLLEKPLGFIFVAAVLIAVVIIFAVPIKSIALFAVLAITAIWLLYSWDSRVLGFVALMFLCAVPVMLVLKRDRFAEWFAIMVYYFLVATVIVQVKEVVISKKGAS